MITTTTNKMKLFLDFAINILELALSVVIFIPIAFIVEHSLNAILTTFNIEITGFVSEIIRLMASFVALITSCFASWFMYEKARKLKIDNDIKRLEERKSRLSFYREKIEIKKLSDKKDHNDIDSI